MIKFRVGDCLKVMARMPDRSVHCVVTSPPYFGLRDYGTATWEGGSEGCDHRQKATTNGHTNSPLMHDTGEAFRDKLGIPYRDTCRKCGARRVDRQIGLEPTPEAFVATMVRVFREVRRVLRDDGTCWLNLGDSYATQSPIRVRNQVGYGSRPKDHLLTPKPTDIGLKTKDLIGIPWRVALALQADGWYLRSDIIWHKPNPMPESVRDRPTKGHEHVFLLSKRERYYFDAEAVRENRDAEPDVRRRASTFRKAGNSGKHLQGAEFLSTVGRNLRSVWTIATHPYKGAHFATFPPALVARCVKAGTSEKGCCPGCGAPWERVVERERLLDGHRPVAGGWSQDEAGRIGANGVGHWRITSQASTLGWAQSCPCPAHDPIPCTVLDPFAGAGTVGLVSDRLGRDHVGIDLNPEYVAMARRRIAAERKAIERSTD